MAKRKIAIITATRAEYGLFYPLLKEIEADPDLELKILATGTHVQEKFGLTVNDIKADGFDVHQTPDIFSNDDRATDIVNNFSSSASETAKYLQEINPDILVVLGDRYEMLGFTIAAFLMRIPVAHIGGGEITSGALDDSIRHAITKLSSIHFPMTDLYAKRLIQMGENPEQIHTVGSTGVENAMRVPLLGKAELETVTGFTFGAKNLLATFHPVTTEPKSSMAQLEELFEALDQHNDICVLFTMPNADEGGRDLFNATTAYAAQNSDRIHFVKSLGFRNYLSSLQFFDGVIGNSSSGLIEAPSFKIGTINIGSRQDGRIKADSIIDCSSDKPAISKAINTLYSDAFQNTLSTVKNPFYKKGTSQAIKDILKTKDLSNLSYKLFHDLDIVK